MFCPVTEKILQQIKYYNITYLSYNLFTDQAPVTKEKDAKESKKKWTVQIAKQWKKMQPGSSNMPAPSYPEGGSIGRMSAQ